MKIRDFNFGLTIALLISVAIIALVVMAIISALGQ